MASLTVPMMAYLAAAAVSASLSIAGGVAAKKAADKESKALKKIGVVEAKDKRREGRKLLAAQTVAFGGSGVESTFGTPLDVLGDTAAEIELAALRAKFGRDSAARAARAKGKAAQTLGFVNAASTILGAAAMASGAGKTTDPGTGGFNTVRSGTGPT